ncbi:hypothetical protein Q4E93_31760 [Flavitalea sp. BT771]|uniref:hypothetical protein n=1 Tax=Flavitalea sp. BT771 TaxID=3063329 RepID=UPI0026E1E090|nr:hypothetical protein [Flavitalea sp. BT771]MDO6435236.1 hypothetical protein [Flavitalea sp. BT771]MDV6224059.1 hypothetical protein [Flavitalea sp. BT771]
MSDTSQFFTDIVNSMPLDSEWFFQAPHDEFLEAIAGIPYENGEVFVKLILKEENKKRLVNISINDVHELIQQCKVFWKQKEIFVAYDGFVIGTLSNHFDVGETSLAKYLGQDILFIANDW